jgi:hypothetical protein
MRWGPLPPPGHRRVRFLGGFNIPAPGPFARRHDVPRTWGELVVEAGRLTLGPRIDALGAVVPELSLSTDEVLVACPTRADPYGNTSGVAIVRHDAVPLYFWTRSPAEVLVALEALGFRISDQPVEVTR